MKNKKGLMIGSLAVVLVLMIGTAAFANDGYFYKGYSMMNDGAYGWNGFGQNNADNNNGQFYMFGGRSSFNMMGGNSGYNMMGGYSGDRAFSADNVQSLDALKENVENYIKGYGQGLEISDIFIYENSDYYFSIIEEESGRGAMELLVDPTNGYIQQEYGPNMMWNLKYGMMGGGLGMMGSGYQQSSAKVIDNIISAEKAIGIGQSYLDKYMAGLKVEEDGHEFYGYFTFHVEKDGDAYGMISVNGITGDVWYHDWHGDVVDILEGH